MRKLASISFSSIDQAIASGPDSASSCDSAASSTALNEAGFGRGIAPRADADRDCHERQVGGTIGDTEVVSHRGPSPQTVDRRQPVADRGVVYRADQRVDVVVFGDVCRVLNHDVGHAWLPSESPSATSSCRRCLTCVISQRNGIFKEVVASVQQQITTAERPERSEAASAKVTAERPERSEAATAKVTS